MWGSIFSSDLKKLITQQTNTIRFFWLKCSKKLQLIIIIFKFLDLYKQKVGKFEFSGKASADHLKF